MFSQFYQNSFPAMPTYSNMNIMPNMPTMPTPKKPKEDQPTLPDFDMGPTVPVQDDMNYVQGYLKSHIGEYVKIEFLIGTNMLIDREGTLKDVGISYVVLQEPETDDYLMCDIYSIKFVKIFK